MQLTVNRSQVNNNVDRFLRRAGYAYNRARSGKESYSRRLGSGLFPKLHMYIDERGEAVVFSLHLDQKQASYTGHNMHSGEYDGPVVAEEIDRLRSLVSSQGGSGSMGEYKLNKIGHGDYDKNITAPKKNSWWKFW